MLVDSLEILDSILDKENNKGETALHLTGKLTNLELLKSVMLKRDECMTVQDKMGNTPLHNLVSGIAFQYETHDGLKLQNRTHAGSTLKKFRDFLKELGNLEDLLPMKNNDDETVLSTACRAGSTDLAECLYDMGASIKDSSTGVSSPSLKARKCIDLLS